MALLKSKIINGVEYNYWRILQLNQNYDRKDAVVVLGLYKDKETRDNYPNAVAEEFQIDLGSDYHEEETTTKGMLSNLTRQEAYKILLEKAVSADKEDETGIAFFADAGNI